MQQLRKAKSRLILTAEKGVFMDMVMDKAKNQVEQPACRPLPADPTNKYEANLINILKRIKGNPTWMTICVGAFIQLKHVLQCFVVLKYIKGMPPSVP